MSARKQLSPSLSRVRVSKFGEPRIIQDCVAREEPLEIRVLFAEEGNVQAQSIAVTMRTPGDDENLALGFLFTEGILCSLEDVASVAPGTTNVPEAYGNILNVHLREGVVFDSASMTRNVYTTSSCGVCGKTSLEMVHQHCSTPQGDFALEGETLLRLSARASKQQALFAETGAIHGAALFSPIGDLLSIHEDVGRHNALDKLVGKQFRMGKIPRSNTLLWVSGRGSFELVQKAAMAGIPVVVSVGAPSSLAIDLAASLGMTLVGFLGPDSFNIYAGQGRIRPR